MSQNVLIPPNYILPTCTKRLFIISGSFFHHFFPALQILYYFPPNLCSFLSVKIGSISFFSSPGTHQCQYFVGCLAKIINSFTNSDMNNCFRIISIRINIPKVNIVKVYTKNTYFITKKYDITRIFIKKEYIIISK